MSAKRIARLARGLTQIRGVAIYALIACAALALTLYSCSEPTAPQTPTPPIVAVTPTSATHTQQQPTVAAVSETPTSAARATPPPTPTTVAAAPPPQSPTATAAATSPTPPPRVESPPTPIPATPTPKPTTEPAPTPAPTAVPDFLPAPDDAYFTQITAAKYHACGLQADGTALCWGHNVYGSLEVPDGKSDFRQISAGLNFTCGLRIDGAIACWGENDTGQTSPPNGIFDEIAAGRKHVCALDDGALTCWGAGFPDGAETIQEIPLLSAIQAGAGFTCGLTPDADMACWNNANREIAITPGPFTDIGIGLHHACAIKSDGSAFCDTGSWDFHPPSTKFVQLAGGWHHACGITETSDIECWGSGTRGAPGERLSAPEGNFTTLAIGWRNSCALNPDGRAVCWQQPDLQNPPELELQEAFGSARFVHPLDLFPWTDGRIAVVERRGIIEAYSDEPDAAPPETILDLTDKTLTECCDNGMLSAALDNQFEEFPFLYVYYKTLSAQAYDDNTPGPVGRLARFRIEDGQAVRDSELTILEVALPVEYDHGGAVRFGPDGMLYLSIGYNVQYDKPQRLDTLLAKVIRIDIRGATPEQPYRIPPDNPFVDNPEARPEIWAYGMRNPWRYDFAPDGRLFIADVGRDDYEEISLAAAGANLGWPMCEGNLCHEEGAEADADGLTPPIHTYGREDGCAIIGGVTAPQFNNGFIFGDYCSKRVWLLEQDEQEGWRTRLLALVKTQILSFAIVDDETVYVLISRHPIMRLQLDDASPTAQAQTTPLPTPTPIPATPTPLPTMEPTPTPTPAPNSLPLPDDARFTQIAAGWQHACGLQSDGTVLCWGSNRNGSLGIPDGLTLSRISAGVDFTCGLRVDGAIACWGRNDFGQASPPLGSFDDIAAGQNHACALANGALICWGKGFPDGPQIIHEIPTFLSTIQAGSGFTCGLTSDADMACWNNADEEYEIAFDHDGSELAITPGPFAELAIGLHHACAIKSDGSVFCDLEERKHYSQRARPPSTKFVQATGGWFHACGITEASDIECWGSGSPSAAGQRLNAPEGKFAAVSIGWRNSCALNPDGYATCWRQPDIQQLPFDLREAFGGIIFEKPVDMFSLPEGRFAVVDRKGVINAYSDEPNGAPPQIMLDISDIMFCCEYRHDGMSAAALDPQFEEFPFLYVYYRTLDEHPAEGEDVTDYAGRIKLERFRVEDGQAVRDSGLIMLDVQQPHKWHYSGAIRFGADGMLYIATGSNSSNWTQSLQTLHGKILRIDVRGATPEQPYRIPPDNPFVDDPEALPEIWIYGMKNPWRMDFAPDGRLFIADVGRDHYEEISLAGAGANLGMYFCEGNLCKEGKQADADGFTAPIFTYGRDDGCAIIGGVTAPQFNNGFIFADYCTGRVFVLENHQSEGWRARILAQAARFLSSFYIDADGTVYTLAYGKPIMRMLPAEVQE